jgi:CHASE2 domain-containing sensor protein
MHFWHRMTSRLGALPAKRVTWGLVLTFSVWVVLDVFVFKLTGGVAQSSFDAMVRNRVVVAAPDPRIVIIDIDEASLARMGKEFGRWPWPRDTLATVLEHIERQAPVAVAWDLVFSDADRMSPGGDAAFNEAAARSLHSHFSVVRLPQANDSASQITRAALPGLWLAPGPGAQTPQTAGKASTVALIAPALPAVASGRLGYNNGYVDTDGVLRRYRYLEPLADGSAIQSLPLSVLSAINPVAYDAYWTGAIASLGSKDELISWRKHAGAYPHISFADVFAQADGGKPQASLPTLAGKVVIIGSTAPSLHDIHPTPLSPTQAGVDSLATALDNALNQRHLRELPRALQAGLAIALCVGLALWVQFKSASSLAPALLALPAALMGISYLSLNGLPVFLDLHLAAGLALVFLAVLRYWNTLRRSYWCSPPPRCGQALTIWPWLRSEPWLEGPLDRLIDAVERHAPSCRVVVFDASATWPSTLRWPELARFAAVVGPVDAMLAARAKLEPALRRLARRSGEPVRLDNHPNRETLAKNVFTAWATLQDAEKIQ